MDLGELCILPQPGLGGDRRKSNLVKLASKSDIWWHQFNYHHHRHLISPQT